MGKPKTRDGGGEAHLDGSGATIAGGGESHRSDTASHRGRPRHDELSPAESVGGSGVVRAGAERTADRGALDATAVQGTTDEVRGSRPDPGTGSVRSGTARTVSQGALDETRVGGVGLDHTVAMEPADAGGGIDPAPALPSTTLGSRIPAATQPSHRPSPTASAVEPFGPYSKIETLARQGSIGLVARGYNEDFGRWELLKFLRDELRSQVELVRQFKREGRVLAQLAHPNVVQVFATHEVAGRTCLAMEFLQGVSLDEDVVSSADGLPVDRALTLFLEAARGLAAAHEVGLLHRDLKPENLFVTQAGKGRVGGLKLIDFGLATLDRARRDAIVEDPTLLSGTSGGTPLYMAPELWQGREATQRSDLYALGLTFFFALTRRLPIEAETIDDVRAAVLAEEPFPSVRDYRPDVVGALAAVIDRLIQKRPERRFPDADALVASLVQVAARARPRQVPGSGPYRGLAPFTANERDVFFGRDPEVAEITERLRAHSGIVLVGPSGSGKSSLARAGVVPAIADGALGGGILFRSAALEPRGAPVAALAAALTPVLGGDPAELTARLRREPHRMGQWIHDALGEGRGLVIVVDQLEELTTVAHDGEAVADFAAALGSVTATLSSSVRVIATLRADLMDRLFTLEPLRPLLTRGFYPVRPLRGEALRRALLEPARTAGYDLEEPAVADSIIAEVERTPAGLPLMSFAMSAWWAARDEERHLLPVRAWREMGGVAGALVRHGDSVLDALGRDERQAAEQILLKLVTADGTRAVVSREQLTDLALSGMAGKRALERLLQAKLLIEQGGEVELVHEALIERWPRLRELLAAAGEDRAYRERVILAAQQWEAQHHADGALWDGDQATRLLRWFESTDIPLGQIELGFVAAVRRRAQRRRFALRVAAGVVLTALVVAGGTVITSVQRLQAQVAAGELAAATAASASAVEQQGLLEDLATLRVEHDPAGALQAAIRARELGKASRLDPLGWRIHMAGVPRALPRHDAVVTRVAISPRGGQIATADARGRLRLLASAGPDAQELEVAPNDAITSVRYAPEGGWLAWGTARGTVTSAALDGTAQQRLGKCPGAVSELAWQGEAVLALCDESPAQSLHRFSRGRPDQALSRGGRVAFSAQAGVGVGNVGTTLRLMSLDAPQEVRELEIDRVPSALALSADGRSLWLGAAGVARLPLEGERVPPSLPWQTLTGGGVVRHLSVAPDGTRVLSFDDRHHAALWTADGTLLGTLLSGSTLVRWIPQRGAVVMVGTQLDLLVLDARTGARLGQLVGFSARITDVAVDSDAHWLVAAASDGTIRAYSLDEASARPLPTPDGVCQAAPDATAVVCLDRAKQHLIITPSPADQRVKPRRVPLPESLAPDPSSRVVLAVGPRAEHLAYTTPRGPLVYIDGDRVSVHDLATADTVLAFSSVQPLLAVGGVPGPSLRILDRGRPRPAIRLPAVPTVLAFSADANRVLVGLPQGKLLVLDATSGARRRELALGEASLVALAAAEDGQLAAAAVDGAVHAVAPQATESVVIHRSDEPIRCLSWAHEGRGLLIGRQSGRVDLLDVETGQLLALMKVPGAVNSCARSPSEDRVMVSAAGGPAWQRLLDLSPLFMARPPVNPLDRERASVERWRGLDPEPEPEL